MSAVKDDVSAVKDDVSAVKDGVRAVEEGIQVGRQVSQTSSCKQQMHADDTNLMKRCAIDLLCHRRHKSYGTGFGVSSCVNAF